MSESNIDFSSVFSSAFFTVLAVSSIAANILVSFVILRYRELRKDVSNILLLHMNIVQILFLFSVSILTEISVEVGSSKLFCYINKLEPALVICVFWLLVVITADWYIKTYCRDKNPNTRRKWDYVAVTIAYIIIIVVGYYTSDCSYSADLHASPSAVTLRRTIIFSLVVLAFMVVVNIVHRVHGKAVQRMRTNENPPDNIGLTIANIFMVACVTVYPPILIAIYEGNLNLIIILSFLAAFMCFAIPIFNMIYLFRCHNFNVFLERTVRCQCNESREPQEGPSVVCNDVSGVLIDEQNQFT